MPVNQRKHPRYPVEVAAEIEIGANVLVAATQNMSNGGVALVIDRALEEGTQVGLTLFLTQDGIEDPDEEPFVSKATIVWTAEREKGSFVCGANFAGLSAGQTKQLSRFLEKLG